MTNEVTQAEQAAWQAGIDEGRAQASAALAATPAADAPVVLPEPDAREVFEDWALQQPWIKDCQRDSAGVYGHYETKKAWGAWQAGRALLATGGQVQAVEALQAAKEAINSMKAEAEIAAQGDEQMMLEACEQISNEGLAASEAIDAAIAAAPQAQADARDALTQAELLELRRAADDFDEGCDTDVEHDLLARGALAGYLHCERFVVLDGFALDAAIAAAKGE